MTKIIALHHHPLAHLRPFSRRRTGCRRQSLIHIYRTNIDLVCVEQVPQGPPKANDNQMTVND